MNIVINYMERIGNNTLFLLPPLPPAVFFLTSVQDVTVQWDLAFAYSMF